MKTFIPQVMLLKVPSLSKKDGFGIIQPTKVDMPLKTKKERNKKK